MVMVSMLSNSLLTLTLVQSWIVMLEIKSHRQLGSFSKISLVSIFLLHSAVNETPEDRVQLPK